MGKPTKAVVLLSGGLDSATVLALARHQGYECHALSVAYGQRHIAELNAASRLARSMEVTAHQIIHVNLDAMGGSALTDLSIAVPEQPSSGIPVTYVPARNTLFLSLALGRVDVIGAHTLFIGINAVDYSGYPDCRPEFVEAFERLARVATKAGVEGTTFEVHTPLLRMSKAEIIAEGLKLGVDYGQTVSCYQADVHGHACGVCDSCRIRRQGFADAGITDPTRYR